VKVGPLSNIRIAVIRADSDRRLVESWVRSAGAIPTAFDVLRIGPEPDSARFDDIVRRILDFDWLLVTSANAVNALSRRFQVLRLETQLPAHIASVGPSTAMALQSFQRSPDVIPDIHTASEVIAHLCSITEAEKPQPTILWPRSALADPALTVPLAANGWNVESAIAYSVEENPSQLETAVSRLAAGAFDLMIMTSGSAVRAISNRAAPPKGWPPAVVLGPATARVAESVGMKVAAAMNTTAEAVVDACLNSLRR
jgi:uroporphyrinogen III methyltransferase/synthase